MNYPKHKILLIDMDGTLVTTKSGKPFPENYSDRLPSLYLPAILQRYKDEGWAIAMVTNQGGIEAGFKTIEDTVKELRYVMNLYPMIDLAYFSPEDSDRTWWRKLQTFLGIRADTCYLVSKCNFQKIDKKYFTDDWIMYNGGRDRFRFRKPGAGKLFVAASVLCNEGWSQALMVGDREDDKGAAETFGCYFEWVEEFILKERRD